ncbi:hypothetical protein [Dickeya zeae]|uniref:hypothetical protein n=1 Tax=Dickeya zeae TaxID=204042 RepID=UPI00057676AD|nr:hypothetical protein [Dickeya zeae]
MTQKLPQQSDWGLELSKLGSKNVKENLQPSRSDWNQELCKLDGQNLRENLQDAFDATRSAVRVAAPVLDVLLSPRREDSRSRLDKEFEEREKISNRYYYNKDYYD